jgi:trehalose 6-phosphate phosphatase
MRYLFGPGYEERFKSFLASRPLLAFDFDGTLSPLVEQPALAQAGPETRRLLARLATLYPVVLISGRMRADVEQRFANVPLAGVTGNHGLEPWGDDPEVERLVAGWRDVLQRELARLPGIIIEDKRLSLTIDYRHAPDLEATARVIHAIAHQLPRARLLGGRHADFNIAPNGDVHKGTALRQYLARFERETALYIGDDRTDEDVFALDLAGLISVRVGPRRTSHAAFFIHDQSEVDRLLQTLLVFGPQPPSRRLNNE